MKKTYGIIAISCFLIAVVYAIGMIFLYDRLAAAYQSPSAFYVNLTGMAGLLGTLLLIGGGIFSSVKALRKPKDLSKE